MRCIHRLLHTPVAAAAERLSSSAASISNMQYAVVPSRRPFPRWSASASQLLKNNPLPAVAARHCHHTSHGCPNLPVLPSGTGRTEWVRRHGLPGVFTSRQQPARSVRCFNGLQSLSSTQPPAAKGQKLTDVDTPALLVDLDAFEVNCAHLKTVMSGYPGVAIRPHAKAHKSPDLAKLQLSLLGNQAVGMCAQKVSEAEALVLGGIKDVLLSNEVVSPAKISRLVALANLGARISVCVDAAAPLAELGRKTAAAGVTLDVLVEVNAGQDRCGVDTPSQAASLARQVLHHSPSLRFKGIQAYHGGLQHVRDPGERAAAVGRVVERAKAAVHGVMEVAGVDPHMIVTGGGSGTYRLEAGSGVFTEVQPGSFAFGDADYSRNQQEGGQQGEWRQALWVLTQVMSVNEGRGMVVVDAGMKAVSLDSGPPQLLPGVRLNDEVLGPGGEVGVEYVSGGDEHGKLMFPQGMYQAGPVKLPALGSLLMLQPGHCDPTFNMYDWVVAYRGDRVEQVWPIMARGPGS